MSDEKHDSAEPEREEGATPPEARSERRVLRRRKAARSGKKERVLHTRVPEVLEEELKRLATNLRLPVSNVVRAILEDALDTMDAVGRRAEGELRGAAEMLETERQRLRQRSLAAPGQTDRPPAPATPPPPSSPRTPGLHRIAGAIAFTPIVLAEDTRCAVTGELLAAGSQGFLALFTEPGRQEIVGPGALPRPPTSQPENNP